MALQRNDNNRQLSKVTPTVNNAFHVDTSALDSDKGYQELLAANPFQNYVYTPGLWDKIGNFFGFRTKEDKYREDMQNASRQTEFQLLSNNREEQYNSELSQVQRQTAAGINPDLNGVNPSSAAEFNEPESMPSAPDGDEGMIMGFIGNLFTGMNVISGLSKDILGLRSLSLGNEKQQLDNFNAYLAAAKGYILDTATPESLDYSSNPDSIRASEMYNISKGMLSKKAAKRFNQALQSLSGSLGIGVEGYDLKSKFAENRIKAASATGSKYYSEDDKELQAVQGLLSSLAYDVAKSSSEIALKRNTVEDTHLDNVQEYESEAQKLGLPAEQAETEYKENDLTQREINAAIKYNLPEKSARAEASGYDLESQQKQMITNLQSELSKCIEKMKHLADHKNRFAQVGLILLSAMQANLLPQINISRSEKVSKNSSSSSWHFGFK